ncbi:MAG: DUF1848 domain-containing protein [Bacteroidetes bacterium]|nr:DUF1848 domain-containing protein [Bacteroidota bacterium]MBU1718500.1 DUF1848 domain-containing protein [Bacteroidota bacterium]
MILSVSRRTDIPAFFSEWFYNRIAAGFLYVKNPFNKNHVYNIDLNPEKIDCIVFWTKNPSELIHRLDMIKKYNYYFQFTINPYNDSLERNVPNKNEIIETFAQLSRKIGRKRVMWRYDPILLTNEIDLSYHIRYFEEIARKLAPFTEKCIISFLDMYKKCELNLPSGSPYILDNQQILFLMESFQPIAEKHNLTIETCAEEIDLEEFGVRHGSCIDSGLIENLARHQLKVKKDKNQRKMCGCMQSVDIGVYNTCSHNCLYCYANYNSGMVRENLKLHDPKSPLLIGNLKPNDMVIERKM